MKFEFPIFLAAALLLGSSGAEAAQTNHNIILAPPISSTPPQTNPGAIGLLNPANPAFGASQNFGALPGNPGSPTYNPNAALPSLGNSGSALAPSAGTSSSGINTPSTTSGM
jgi:hypothetical protein